MSRRGRSITFYRISGWFSFTVWLYPTEPTIRRGEHFRHARNVQGKPASSSLLSYHAHNQPTLPINLIYPSRAPETRPSWVPGPSPPRSWRLPPTSTPSSTLLPSEAKSDIDITNTAAWREGALLPLFSTGVTTSSSSLESARSRLIYPDLAQSHRWLFSVCSSSELLSQEQTSPESCLTSRFTSAVPFFATQRSTHHCPRANLTHSVKGRLMSILNSSLSDHTIPCVGARSGRTTIPPRHIMTIPASLIAVTAYPMSRGMPCRHRTASPSRFVPSRSSRAP